MEPLDVIRLAALVSVMAWAAFDDMRTRRVPDGRWLAMLAVGVPLASLSMGDTRAALCHLVGASFMAAYVLSPRLVGMRAAPVIACSFAATLLSGDPCVAAMPFVTMLFPLLHRLRAIAGGADVKCLMSLSLTLPSLPGMHVPPVLAVALLALVLSMLWTVPVLARNVRDRRVGRGMLTSYVARVDDVNTAFEWPVRRLEGDALVPCRGSPDTADAILAELREAGVQEVEVTPSVPFIAPLAMSLAAVLLVTLA